MAQDMNKEAQEMTKDPIANTQPKREDARPKRVTKKPTYLKDYVQGRLGSFGVVIIHSG